MLTLHDHQSPAVFLVGPYSTLRIRIASPPASGTGLSPFGAMRGRHSPLARSKASRGGKKSVSPTGGDSRRSGVTLNSSIEAPVVPGKEVHLAVVVTPTEVRSVCTR